jgi:transcriptional regulator with XRE-family HTH domain
VNNPDQQPSSAAARGRVHAREGMELLVRLGSVKKAAAELMSRHREIPSLAAYRYAAGLSQDQAAARYNEESGNLTSLGGTTINAWETWARGRRSPSAGSPPPISRLLILANTYGRRPSGEKDEDISPMDLVSEAYERLPPEDQYSLKLLTELREGNSSKTEVTRVGSPVPAQRTNAQPLAGPDFTLTVPTGQYDNPEICAFTLPNPQPGQLLDLDWNTFGFGVQRLSRQIKSLGRRLDVDICFGINEAGLVMATFLASAQFSRCAIGYLRCDKVRDEISLSSHSHYPTTGRPPTILICDFEVKHADVVGLISQSLRERYPGADLYFAVFGAMTKGRDLEVASFDDLTGAKIMRAANFSAVFIAATMSPPGIEPPLELR